MFNNKALLITCGIGSYRNSDKIEVVEIPTGYMHSVENLGDADVVIIMWTNETFDPEKPDTYFLEV